MKLKKLIAAILCTSLVTANIAAVSAEDVAATYIGIDIAQQTLNNMDFRDISTMPNSYWAKDAIYKMGSLGIIQGYGEKSFRPRNNVTKAEALALVYRALGKEADAQKEAQRLEDARSEDLKKKRARDVWADGYLSLAQKDGLITNDEFQQATNVDSFFSDASAFNVNSPAQRQEIAEWAAKAFKIEPVYNQTAVFNNYKDWERIDQEKIPYVEALLKNKIMNGDNGNFFPTNSLRREEAAQILTNMEDYIYKANNLNKKSGFIENIAYENNKQPTKEIATKTLYVRTSDGKLNAINLSSERTGSVRNSEVGSNGRIIAENEVVVNRAGELGKSDKLVLNDEISFIYDKDNKVKFIEAKPKTSNAVVYYGAIDNIDTQNNTISAKNAFGASETYPVSDGAIITIGNEPKSLTDIPFGAKAYFTINHNLVTRIEVSNPKKENIDTTYSSKGNDVTGVVSEINPNLNYLSIYGPNGKKDAKLARTFNFLPDVNVKKAGIKAKPEDIEVGDTVYIKFDDAFNIDLINVETNHISKYGEVLIKNNNSLTARYDDGTTQELTFDKDVLVVKDGKVVNKGAISLGDRVKLTLNQNDNYTKIKAVKIEGDQHYITNIYKGKVAGINGDNIELTNIRALNKDKWVEQPQRGFFKFDVDKAVKLYNAGSPVGLPEAKDLYLNKNAYVATYKDYGGNEKVVMVTAVDGFEKAYNDEVITHSKSGKNFEVSRSFDAISYNDGTIVTRYGRLTSGTNIETDDPVYVVALRDPMSEDIEASVIQIADKPSIAGIDIYRGRITSIDEGKNFTIESFSMLKGTDWDFVNTTKTLDLTGDTRIIGSGGVINNRDFIDYTENSYKGKIVYVAAKGTQALTINDNIYGVINLRGEVYQVAGSDNVVSLKLRDITVKSMTTGDWNELGEGTIDVPVNAIAVKNKRLVDAGEIAVGDKIRVIKKDDKPAGEALILLVEE